MPLFSHSHKSESGETASDMDAHSTRGTIGALLRETRQSYGGDIAQIAGILRIRAAYLSAIEDGRYDGLPAPVYALGFVRAYANHLGLDGDEAVRRFKQETVDFGSPRGLSFPVPLAERSIPGGTMLLAALILAFCGYGLWYYVSTGERARPERVSPVPAELAKAALPPAPAAPAIPSSVTAVPAPASAPAPSTTANVAPNASSQSAAPAGNPPAVAVAIPAPSSAPTSSPVTVSPVTASPPSTGTGFPPPGVTILPHPAAVPEATASPATQANPAQVGVATPATAAPTPPPAPPATTTSPPHVYGAVDGPARIVLHALKDDWVQVRDGDKVVTQRLLHQGDTLRVPDMPGLTMTAGDGAGLSIEVDGKNVPSLGAAVRHNVLLDPAKLEAGTAVADQAPTPRAQAPATSPPGAQ